MEPSNWKSNGVADELLKDRSLFDLYLIMAAKSTGAGSGFPTTRNSLVGGLGDWDDADKWGEFGKLYSPIILAIARKAGLREADAEEVLQAVLLKAAFNMRDESRRYHPEGGRFRGWLLNLVRWKIGEQFAKSNRRDRDRSGGGEDVLNQLPDEAAVLPDEEVERRWRELLFEAAIDNVKRKVSLKQFQIFQMYVLNEMSAKEVCDQLNVSRMQVYLAKNRVSHLVQKETRRLVERTDAAEHQVDCRGFGGR